MSDDILIFNPRNPRPDGSYDDFGTLGTIASVIVGLESEIPGLLVARRSWACEAHVEDAQSGAVVHLSFGSGGDADEAIVDSITADVEGDLDAIFPVVGALHRAFGWHAKTFDEGHWLTPVTGSPP